jgi:hypothetical protein
MKIKKNAPLNIGTCVCSFILYQNVTFRNLLPISKYYMYVNLKVTYICPQAGHLHRNPDAWEWQLTKRYTQPHKCSPPQYTIKPTRTLGIIDAGFKFHKRYGWLSELLLLGLGWGRVTGQPPAQIVVSNAKRIFIRPTEKDTWIYV